MFDGLRATVRTRAAALPRGLRILLGIFGVLLWVLGAQYLAGDAVRVAEWVGVGAGGGAGGEGALVAVFLIAFGVALVAPFVLLTDWEAGESARSAAAILGMMAWFLVADAAATPLGAVGVPYGAAVAAVFLAPFLVLTALRFRGVGGDTAESCGR
ncbi:hypothetical protein GCM10027435_07250 [Haloparvum alkalitolerans]|uniref:hypothetical protein n=1 Tax=Haloparvum alkalitolerans TaxID=1042953 RepID=UPI003CE8A719